jgi:hypothetical protein
LVGFVLLCSNLHHACRIRGFLTDWLAIHEGGAYFAHLAVMIFCLAAVASLAEAWNTGNHRNFYLGIGLEGLGLQEHHHLFQPPLNPAGHSHGTDTNPFSNFLTGQFTKEHKFDRSSGFIFQLVQGALELLTIFFQAL